MVYSNIDEITTRLRGLGGKMRKKRIAMGHSHEF